MKFRVIGGPLQADLAVEASHSDSFRSIFKKVQKAAGKSVALDGYDLHTTAVSPLTGDLVASAGPLHSGDTPTSAQLDSKQEQPHTLMLVQRDAAAGRGSVQNSLSCSTTVGGGDATSVESVDMASTSPPEQDAYRQRMRALYLKYDPEQLHRVDVALDRYRGYEEDVLRQLVKRYGPEPAPGEVDTSAAAAGAAVSTAKAAPSTPAAATGEASVASYRDRLAAMYGAYEPAKLSKVDGTLRRYAGREEEVLQLLVKKYGPEPAAGTAASVAAATPRAPAAAVSTPRTPEPAATAETSSPITITMSERKEGYSAATTPRDATNTADSALVTPRNLEAEEEFTEATRAATLDYGERLRRMYATYDPQKLRLVEGTLKKFKGREEAVIKQLVKIYGPEPVVAADTTTSVEAPAASSPAPLPPLQQSPVVEEPPLEQPVPVADARPVTAARGTTQPTSAATEATAAREEAASTAASPPTADVVPAAPSQGAAPATAPSLLSSSDGTSPRDLDAVSAAAPGKPVPPPEASATPASTGGRYRERLVALYHAYNPVKLHTVEGTLKKFAGKEEVAIQQLVRRYGPEPTALTPRAAQELLLAAATGSSGSAGGGSGASTASPIASPITANVPGSSGATTPHASLPASPVEPTQPTPANPRQRIVDILSAHEPGKVDRADRILETYRGREEEVIAKLELRYAATRGNATVADPTSTPSAAAAVVACSDLAETTPAKESTAAAAAPPPPSLPMTAAPSNRSSFSNAEAAHSVAAAKAPSAVKGHADEAVLLQPPAEPAKPFTRSAPRYRAALRVVAAHLEDASRTAVLRRWWPMWAAHRRAKKSAELLEQGLWSRGPGESYHLNDSVQPAYTVATLDVVVTAGIDEATRASHAFSSELQLAARALLTSLRQCVQSRVVEAQSSSERELADALLAHWAVPEHLCPVTDSPELASALQQAAHLIGQLGDVMTVIRTQAGQLQQLKALHRDVVERMGHMQEHAEALDRLQAQLDSANNDKQTLQHELARLRGGGTAAQASHRNTRSETRAAVHQNGGRSDQPRRVYPTAEERKDAQIVKLQQELAKSRNSLFHSKETEEKMKVQLQHARAREARRDAEGRHREGTSARHGGAGLSDTPARSHSARAGDVRHNSLSNSPPRRSTPSSTPRGAFSRAIAQETPRRTSHDGIRVNGRAVSSIRKLDVSSTQERGDTSITCSTPWPSTRYVMTAVEVDRGPCPNCLTPLTSCSSEVHGDASEKAGFCFSCRRSFTFGQLRTRGANEAVAQL